MKAYISDKAFNPVSFIARFDAFIDAYVKEKQQEILNKCCKRCQKKLKFQS